jgi:hypothetical protein
LVLELAKRRVVPVPSASAVYRALVRAGMIDPMRGNGLGAGAVGERNPPTMSICHNSIGVPRSQRFHSRERVCATLMARERTRAVCDGLRAAVASYGAPEQILTDNSKVFTGRFNHPPVKVLFNAICREHGTAPP